VVPNQQVIEDIKTIQADPDTDYGHRKMTTALMLIGYFINHKKVYRIMKKAQLLKERHKKAEKTYAKYRIVTPTNPLEVLEVDIKYVWVTEARRQAYILTIIDTFTRHVLHWQVGFTMKTTQVKAAWEAVITQHLQPADLLRQRIDIEIRNDNGPQFCANIIRAFFEENHLNQVFTHPYTPQENGHIESFHSILSNALRKQTFWNLEQLETRLTLFYEKYNNTRLHGSIANLPPRVFWELWQNGKITRKEMDNKKVKFKLNIPYQQLSGNGHLKGVPCLNFVGLDVQQNLEQQIKKEAIGPETLQQPSV
jgi:transposase InsO family protein